MYARVAPEMGQPRGSRVRATVSNELPSGTVRSAPESGTTRSPEQMRRQGAGGTGERGNELAGMGGRKSERLTVPRTRGNSPQETPSKGKGRRDMGPLEGTMDGTPSPEDISPGLQRIAELARRAPGLEVDIKSFFDTLDYGHLRSFLDRRVRDGVIQMRVVHSVSRHAAKP